MTESGCTVQAHPHKACAQVLYIVLQRESQVHASKVAAGDRRTAVFFVRPRDRSVRVSVYSTVATHSPASASSPVGKPKIPSAALLLPAQDGASFYIIGI